MALCRLDGGLTWAEKWVLDLIQPASPEISFHLTRYWSCRCRKVDLKWFTAQAAVIVVCSRAEWAGVSRAALTPRQVLQFGFKPPLQNNACVVKVRLMEDNSDAPVFGVSMRRLCSCEEQLLEQQTIKKLKF